MTILRLPFRWVMVPLAMTLLALGVTPPASAAPTATAMVQTQKMRGPALPPKYSQVGTYAQGQRLTLSCYERGQAVSGYYSRYVPGGTSNIWYKVSDGYWVADIDLNTGSNNPVAPQCSPPPATTPTPTTSFKLPFAKGYRARITQAPYGKFSHSDSYNRHAVDFGVPSGTRIVASGAGRIYYEGWTKNRRGAGIYVLVDHGNNRCTQYAHLGRTVVDRGQRVARGQTIGYSGASGSAAGAHLHWNMVHCNSQVSREVVRTVERGVSYPSGTVVTSTNG